MRHALALILACCALVGLAGCRTDNSAQLQISEAKEALSKGQITMAEYLNLKQQAEQAAYLRRAIIIAAP